MSAERGNAGSGPARGEGSGSTQVEQRSGTIGFVILSVLVAFVAIWMYVQGREALLPSEPAEVAAAGAVIEGFRPDLWQLPDEPMLGFVEIAAGEFLMGSNPAVDRQAYENERWSQGSRQGTVELPRFYIARYEVTVGQYSAFVQDTGRPFVQAALSVEPDHPVANITWTDALAYGRWLQARLLESARTPEAIRNLLAEGWQITLPTEAQWEKSARGSEGGIYPWGNRLLEGRANFGAQTTRPVGSYDCPDCSYGLSDMSGNVWELTRSPFQPYPFRGEVDLGNLGEDALWVMRGGSYADGPANIRAAVRGGVDPGVRNATIGFRLVLTPP
jgi:formylglycine-generating enzyme required for sulfatase activity